MKKLTPESIPYGVSKFEELRDGGLYYIDKSDYIRLLEQRANFHFFVRPRRFGKSLFAKLVAGTPVHFLDIEFKGGKMVVCNEVELSHPQVRAAEGGRATL